MSLPNSSGMSSSAVATISSNRSGATSITLPILAHARHRMRMPDLLTLYAAAQPDKLAVIDDRGGDQVLSWTYAQLEAEANKMANALQALGTASGDKVIWCGPNSARVVAAISGIRKAQAVTVPMNYRL